jgi:hypothetical protein
MKNETYILLLIVTLFLSANLNFAQDSTKSKNSEQKVNQHNNNRKNFIDADGDGYNDNAPDHDGDGIPNGLDPDFIKLKKRGNDKSLEYVDSDGDGINDNLQFNRKRRMRNNKFKNSNEELLPQRTNGNNTIENNKNQKAKGKGKGKG